MPLFPEPPNDTNRIEITGYPKQSVPTAGGPSMDAVRAGRTGTGQ